MVTARTRITAAILAVSVLIEADDRRLGREAVVLWIGAFDRPDHMLSALGISGLKHHLVRGELEVTVKKSYAEAVQGVVFLEDKSDLLQALCVVVADRLDIGNVLQV
jgi:hypothetical protein